MLAALAVGGLGLVAGAWYAGVEPAQLKDAWRVLEQWLMGHPWLLLLALVLLPALPIPSSALLMAAGIVWRDRPLLACLGCVVAYALNMVWTYGLAAGPGRRLVGRLLARTALRVPDLPRGDHLRMILIMRLTPGMPFFFQNYVLGLLRPPFRLYLVLSVVCNAPIVCGLVLSGAGLANGRLLPLLGGIGLIVLAVVITHSVRRWLGRRAAAAG
jgi:uncharacterized membrane protein YdjX (TVP38/TMEM64 family)